MEDQKTKAKQFPQRPRQSAGQMLAAHMGLVRIAVIAVVVLAVLFFGLVAFVHSAISSIAMHQPPPVPTGKVSGSVSVLSSGVLTYNFSKYAVEYSRLGYSEANASGATASLTLYSANPAEPVYLVNVESYCVQCFLGTTLLVDLNSSMHRYGLLLNGSSLNYIDINRLSGLPPNVIVVLPSGLVPNILLPNVTYSERCSSFSNVTLASMLGNGDTVIYVGRNFTRSVSCSGQIAQDTQQETSWVSTFSNSSSYVFPPNVLYLSNPTFFLEQGQMYGPATSTSILNGSLVVLSNYPSEGWNGSASLLASDIAKVIASRFWMDQLAQGNLSLPVVPRGNDTVFTLNSMMPYGNSVSQEINSSYGLLTMTLSNPDSFQEYEVPLRYRLRQNGIIGLPPLVAQTGQVDIEAEVYNASNRVVIAQVPIYNQSFDLAVSPIPIGQIGDTPLYKPTSFQLPSGYYIARLSDERGSKYSSALFFVSNATIVPVSLDFQNGTFAFSATSDGQGINGAEYQISINNAYNSSGYVNDGSIAYVLPKSTVLNYGSGTFSIMLLGDRYSIPYQYAHTGFSIPPLYIAFIVAAVFIAVLNKLLVPASVDEYFIDVPDLKPPKAERASEPADTVLSVFDSVNRMYHWKDMPLTPEEVRSGIGNNIRYGNARISISMRNTYSILGQLISRGLVVTAGNYYAPAKWVGDSGHDIEYLVIYRKLRDYSIANAMLMTEMDSSSRADVIITSKGTQNSVKIYSKDAKLKDIEISQRMKTFIVFIDEETRLAFMDRLYLSYGTNAEVLKMALNYGNVKLVQSDNLGELKI